MKIYYNTLTCGLPQERLMPCSKIHLPTLKESRTEKLCVSNHNKSRQAWVNQWSARNPCDKPMNCNVKVGIFFGRKRKNTVLWIWNNGISSGPSAGFGLAQADKEIATKGCRNQIFKLSSGRRPSTSSTEAMGRFPLRLILSIS